MAKPIAIGYGLWCSLGVYRGFKDYNNKYDKDYKLYLEKPNLKKPEYYYTDCIGSSFMGLFVYANPILLPIFAYHEVIDLEKKIRGFKKD